MSTKSKHQQRIEFLLGKKEALRDEIKAIEQSIEKIDQEIKQIENDEKCPSTNEELEKIKEFCQIIKNYTDKVPTEYPQYGMAGKIPTYYHIRLVKSDSRDIDFSTEYPIPCRTYPIPIPGEELGALLKKYCIKYDYYKDKYVGAYKEGGYEEIYVFSVLDDINEIEDYFDADEYTIV